MGTINSLSNSYLQSILSDLQHTASTNPSSTTSTSNNQAASSVGQSSDASQLSPLAQVLSTLQQLQQSNPTEYQQLTGQIATNLQSAAQTASNDGNPSAANQLNQLATDFTNASKSGQLPDIQDLAQAFGGGGHHHHSHHHASDAQPAIDSTSAAFQTSTQSQSLNPLTIILNTLSGAGTGSSSS